MRCAALALGLVLAACGGTRSTTIPLGEPCNPAATPDNGFGLCANGLCVSLDNVSGFCSQMCMEDSDCGDGFICQGAGRFGRICKKKIGGCKVDADCPSGHTCNADSGRCYIKVSRGLCSPCQDGLQCPMGGSCFEALSSHEQFCTTPCGAGDACPIGFSCTDLPTAPGSTMTTRQCAPTNMSCNAGKPLCATCRGDAECGGPFDVCVRNVVSGEQFCGRDCNPAKNVCPMPDCDPLTLIAAENPDCPTGFSCTNIGQSDDPNVKGPYQCVPNSNTCVNYCDATTEAEESRQCGLGHRCVNNRCTPATDGRMCTPCSTTDDCRRGMHPENRCIVNNCPTCPFRGEAFCTTPCVSDAACVRSFGVGFLCNDVTDTDGSMKKMCMPQRGSCATGLGHLGDDCTKSGAQDCINGVCLVAGTTALCSLPCAHDAECGDTRYHCCEVSASGYDCAESKRSGDGPTSGSGVCAPLGGLFGDDCTPGRPPCQTGTCLDLGTSQVCTVTCPSGAACPDGFACRPAAMPGMSGTLDVCFPNGGGGIGADCSFGPAACSSGYCIRKESGPVCTNSCVDASLDCPMDWSCEMLSTVDNMSVTACLPPELQ